MQIQINTDHNIAGDEAAAAAVRGMIREALRRDHESITRVEVHLSDQDGSARSAGPEMRCLLEARLEGREPVAVSHSAPTVDQAVQGAASKLARLIRRTHERTRDRREQP